MRGHTVGIIPMGNNGWGSILRISKEQNPNKNDIDRGRHYQVRQCDAADAMDRLILGSAGVWY